MRKHYSPDTDKLTPTRPRMKQVYLSYSKLEKPRPQTSYVPRPRKSRLSDDASDSLTAHRSLKSSYRNADTKSAVGSSGARLKSAVRPLEAKTRVSGRLDRAIIRPSQDMQGDMSKTGAVPKGLKSATALCKVQY